MAAVGTSYRGIEVYDTGIQPNPQLMWAAPILMRVDITDRGAALCFSLDGNKLFQTNVGNGTQTTRATNLVFYIATARPKKTIKIVFKDGTDADLFYAQMEIIEWRDRPMLEVLRRGGLDLRNEKLVWDCVESKGKDPQ